jgi:pimeloyl-ACP methyl ester carboxylesterase
VGEERGVVFTLDGSGNFQGTSAALRQALAEQRVPIRQETVVWSHGFGRVLADQIDYAHARAEGLKLAARVAALRQSCPETAVFLVGHSAGCGVVLAAAEALPPQCVDSIVLLSPSVSADYDLRPALRSVRRYVDVFASERDLAVLGVGTGLVGTADRKWTAPGGRTGFCPQVATPEDAALYQKLRQHPWHPCLAWTGHTGGHYGAVQPTFMRAYVVPLLEIGGCGNHSS